MRAFIAHEGPSAVPPRIGFETLAAIHRDFVADGSGPEMDLLLGPPDVIGRRTARRSGQAIQGV